MKKVVASTLLAAIVAAGVRAANVTPLFVTPLYMYDTEYSESGSIVAAFAVESETPVESFTVDGIEGEKIGAFNGRNQVFLIKKLKCQTTYRDVAWQADGDTGTITFATPKQTHIHNGGAYHGNSKVGSTYGASWMLKEDEDDRVVGIDVHGAETDDEAGLTTNDDGWTFTSSEPGKTEHFVWPEIMTVNGRDYVVLRVALRAVSSALPAPTACKFAVSAPLYLGSVASLAERTDYGLFLKGARPGTRTFGVFCRPGGSGVLAGVGRAATGRWFGAVDVLPSHRYDDVTNAQLNQLGEVYQAAVSVSWSDLDLSSGDFVKLSVVLGVFDAETLAEDAGEPYISFAAEGWEGTYDGRPHGISVTALDPTDATVQYALQEEGPYREAPYTFTNVNETATDVWFRLEAEGYVAVTNSAKVKISPRAIKLTSGTQSWPYDGKAHSNVTVAVEGTFAAGEGVTTNGFATIVEVGETPNSFAYELILNPGSVKENYAVTCVTGTLAITKAKAELAAEVAWKYLKTTGTYMAQLKVACTSGLSGGVGDLRFLFADRISDGATTAALWDTSKRAAKSTQTTYEGITYRYVALDASRIAAENVPVTYGVSDLAATTIPVAERTIELYVRTRVNPATDADNYIGYVSWVSGGEMTFLPVVAGAQSVSLARTAQTTFAPMRIDRLNLALAVGKPVDEGSVPYCRVVDFAVDGDMISGRVEVGCDDGRMLSPGSIGANAVVTLLGAKSVGGDFEEVGRGRTDGTFRFAKPVDFSFFKANVVVEEVVK